MSAITGRLTVRELLGAFLAGFAGAALFRLLAGVWRG
jgi:hypothetical protein